MNSIFSRRSIIFAIAAGFFLLSQFYRASIAVISPQLTADLALDVDGLSMLSAAFFYPFAIMQVPLGIYLDHIGPRITMAVLSIAAVAGGLVFAWADSLAMLTAGRMLLGIGMAGNLMGPFKLLTSWFAPASFATLSAIFVAIGTAGNMVATSPLVILTDAFGWRWTFTLFAGVNLLLTLFLITIVRDRPPDHPYDPESLLHLNSAPSSSFRELMGGLRLLVAQREYWIISLGTLCRYGVFGAVQTLWAGPFLMGVMGLTPLKTGHVILLMNAGLIIGGPIWGTLTDRIVKRRKALVMVSLSGMAVLIALFSLLPADTRFFSLATLFFMFGFFSSAGMIMYAHIKELMPLSKAGTAMTGINFFTMIGPAVFLQGLSFFMQYLYPADALGPAAFKAAFSLCVICLIGVVVFYAFTKDTRAGIHAR